MRKYEELSNSEVSEVMAIIDDEEFDYDHVYKAIIEIASREPKKRIDKLSYFLPCPNHCTWFNVGLV